MLPHPRVYFRRVPRYLFLLLFLLGQLPASVQAAPRAKAVATASPALRIEKKATLNSELAPASALFVPSARTRHAAPMGSGCLSQTPLLNLAPESIGRSTILAQSGFAANRYLSHNYPDHGFF